MTNYNNLQYYSTLYVGDSQKSMTFIFDTGSTTLWVPLSNCSCHTTNLYTAAGSFSTNGTRSTIIYGSGTVSGIVATDNIRATSGGTAVNIKMLGVDSETSMSGTKSDGLVGMTPTVSSTNSDLFVSKLYLAGLISANAFGVSYRVTTDTSKIVLGGYDTTIVTNSSLFSYVSLYDTTYWSLPLSATSYANTDLGLSAARLILDTGTSFVYFSTSDWTILYNKISSGKTWGYSTVTGYRACYCTTETEFSDITFKMGSYTYVFPRSSWIYVRTGGSSGTLCEFYLDSITLSFSTPSILAGDSFLRNYYIYSQFEFNNIT